MDLIGIQEKNAKLDETINKATILTNTDYQKVLDDIESDTKKLESEKKTYESLANVSEGEEIPTVSQYQKYEIEYLWAIVGNHATSEGVDLKMDLVAGAGTGVYNLNFTIRGSYIAIADFISIIENDSVLGFKIENFNMVPGGSTENLQATFTCKNIQIKLSDKETTSAGNTTDAQNSTDATTTTSTNPDATNANENTTNNNENGANNNNANTTGSSSSTKKTNDSISEIMGTN